METDKILAQVRDLRSEILALDKRLNDNEVAPTGEDYNELYVIANCGLIDLLKALGDATDFGD